MLASLLLSAPTVAIEDDAQSARDKAREAAVERAREGDATGALSELVALRNHSPNDTRLTIDTGVIAAWAGEDVLAVELLGSLTMSDLPTYALSTLAKSARNAGNWDVALPGYDTLIERDLEELDHRLGKIMTLADAGHPAEARGAIETAATHFSAVGPSQVALGLACGYVEESEGRFASALGCYNRALKYEPNNREARKRRIKVASRLGAVDVALDEARANPDVIDADDLLRLEIDAIAMRIRWAELPDGTREGKRDTQYITQMSKLAEDNPHLLDDLEDHNGRAFQFDRISALVAGYEMQQAIDQFEALEQNLKLKGQIPDYTYAAAGRAYLFNELPEQAEHCFRAALAQSPAWFSAQVGLFYALSDQRRGDEARTVAQEMLANEPKWFRPNRRIWLENDKYEQARQIAAMDFAYQERYDQALESLDEMLAIAPANANTRVARAQVLSWRGWNDRATKELSLAKLADPNNIATNLVASHVALDTQRFIDAETSLNKVVIASPQEKSTLLLEERWQVHNSGQIIFQAEAGRSEGSAFSSDSWDTDGYYYSRPVSYNYRGYIHDQHRYGEFVDGTGHDHRIGAGIEYRSHNFTAYGEVNKGLEIMEDTGAKVGIDWRLTDKIMIAGSIAADSVDMPLRGLAVGTSGDTLTTAATYRWHEGRSLVGRYSQGNFDDDNRRQGYSLSHIWRVLNRLNHKLLTNVSVFTSRNTQTNRPYFNPSSDRTYTASLTHEWQIFRRYQRGMVQRFTVEVGDYWQEDFGSDNIWSFRLEHAWSLGARWEVNYGISNGGRMYDGDREHANLIFLGLRGRM